MGAVLAVLVTVALLVGILGLVSRIAGDSSDRDSDEEQEYQTNESYFFGGGGFE